MTTGNTTGNQSFMEDFSRIITEALDIYRDEVRSARRAAKDTEVMARATYEETVSAARVEYNAKRQEYADQCAKRG